MNNPLIPHTNEQFHSLTLVHYLISFTGPHLATLSSTAGVLAPQCWWLFQWFWLNQKIRFNSFCRRYSNGFKKVSSKVEKCVHGKPINSAPLSSPFQLFVSHSCKQLQCNNTLVPPSPPPSQEEGRWDGNPEVCLLQGTLCQAYQVAQMDVLPWSSVDDVTASSALCYRWLCSVGVSVRVAWFCLFFFGSITSPAPLSFFLYVILLNQLKTQAVWCQAEWAAMQTNNTMKA